MDIHHDAVIINWYHLLFSKIRLHSFLATLCNLLERLQQSEVFVDRWEQHPSAPVDKIWNASFFKCKCHIWIRNSIYISLRTIAQQINKIQWEPAQVAGWRVWLPWNEIETCI